MEINGETNVWKTADGVWEARFYSDEHATPRHFKESNSIIKPIIETGNYYLVLDSDVRDDEDQIYGDYPYLIETKEIVRDANDTYLRYEEFHVDRDEPTSDPLSVWDRKADRSDIIVMEEV